VTVSITLLPKYMLICLFFTILFELLLALILKVNNKKDWLNIALVNFLTNPLLVSLSACINILYGYTTKQLSLLIMEILVVIVEGLIYKNVLNYKRINPFLLSLYLNLFSYIMGIVIDNVIF